MFPITILIVAYTPIIFGSGIHVTNLNSTSGIFFEEIGKANLYANEWKVVTYYDLTNFKKEYENIQFITKEINIACSTFPNSSIITKVCNSTVTQINLIMLNIENRNKLLTHNSRRQRSLFNAVGVVSKALFGTLNEDDARHYDEQIQNLTINQNSLLSLIKEQTAIIEATSNLFNKTQTAIQNEFSTLYQQIVKIHLTTKQINNNILENNLAIELESFISLVTLMTTRYQNTQSEILDFITDARHGKFHPTLLSPQQIQNLLTTMKQNLPHSLILPIDTNDNSLTQIYKLSTIAGSIINNKIILEMKLPLPFPKMYQMFRIIPLPTSVNDSFIYINPSTDYILIDYSRNQYYGLNLQDLHNCATINYEQYFCKISSPIFNTMSNTHQCEVKLLKREPISTQCEIKYSNQTSYWIQLTQPNTWLYSLKTSLHIDAICKHSITSYSLQNTGTVHVQPNCYIQTNEFTLYGHSEKSSEIFSQFLPSINVIELHKKLSENTEILTTKNKTVLVKIFDNKELETLSRAISDLKSKESQPLHPINNHHIHHYTLTYTIAIIILIALCFHFYKKYKHNKHPPTNQKVEIPSYPEPAPRRYNITPPPRPKPKESNQREQLDNQEV